MTGTLVHIPYPEASLQETGSRGTAVRLRRAALFAWLVHAAYLRTRTLRGWQGTPGAGFLAVAFLAVVFTCFGNYRFGGLHAYGGK